MHVEEEIDREAETQAAMREYFRDDPWLREVVDALTDGELGDIRSQCRARHGTLNFTIKDGKLWRTWTNAKDWTARAECMTRAEGCQLAARTHAENGHFGWDQTKLKLHDKWFWPGMDRDTRQTITECPQCKSFRPRHLNMLLQPIQ